MTYKLAAGECDRALIVEEPFSGRRILAPALIRKNVKAVSAVSKPCASDHKGLARHIVSSGRNSPGQKLKRICRLKHVPDDPHRPVFVSNQCEWKPRPILTEIHLVCLKRRPYVRPDAADVDVQLVLGAGLGGIYREPDFVYRKVNAGRIVEAIACLPGIFPKVWRTGGEQFRALDAFDPNGRYQEEMRASRLEKSKAPLWIDVETRKPRARVLLSANAEIADHLPKDAPVGGDSGSNDASEQAEGRCKSDERPTHAADFLSRPTTLVAPFPAAPPLGKGEP